jgi:hypothetical protein
MKHRDSPQAIPAWRNQISVSPEFSALTAQSIELALRLLSPPHSMLEYLGSSAALPVALAANFRHVIARASG